MSISLHPRGYARPDLATAERVQSLRDVPAPQFSPDRQTAEAVRADLIERAERGEMVYAHNTTPLGQWRVVWAGSAQASYTPAECTRLYCARVGGAA